MKRRYFVVLIAALLVVVAAVVWYVQRPLFVVERAADRLGEADTARFTAVLALENAAATQQVLGEEGAVELTLDGVFARAKNQADSLHADISFVTKTESVTVNVDGEARFINDQVYVLVEKAPPMLAPLVQLKGQWLSLPRGTFSEQVAHTPPEQLFTDVRRAGTTTLNNETVVVYQAEAKDEAVVNLMDAIAELLGTRLTTEQIDTLRQSVQQVERVPVELKIRRWSTELREIATTLTMPGGNQVNFRLTIHDTGNPVEIAIPDNAVNIEQLIQAQQQQQQ